MNKTKWKNIFLSVGVVGLLLLSTVSTISLTVELYSRMNEDPNAIILQVGTDKNIQLAVNTFIKYYWDEYKIIPIRSRQDLESSILSDTNANYVIFGHGKESGLIIARNSLYPWEELKSFINSMQNNPVLVMACFSGGIEQNYIGFSAVLDAEAAALIALSGLNFNLFERGTIERAIVEKQLQMKHPLNAEQLGAGVTPYKKTYTNSIAAAVGCTLDRAIILVLNYYASAAEYLFGETPEVKVVLDGAQDTFFLVKLLRIQLIPGAWVWPSYLFCIDTYFISIGFDDFDKLATLSVINLIFWPLSEAYSVFTLNTGHVMRIAYINSNGDFGSLSSVVIAALVLVYAATMGSLDFLVKEVVVVTTTLFYFLNEALLAASESQAIEYAAAFAESIKLIKSSYIAPGLKFIQEQELLAAVAGTLAVAGGIAFLLGNLDIRVKGVTALLIVILTLGTSFTKQSAAVQVDDDFNRTGDDDNDGLTNYFEVCEGLNMTDNDTDDDNFSDGWELENGFDPLDPASPIEAMWFDTTYADGNTFYSHDVQGINRIVPYRKNSGANTWVEQSTVNVTSETVFNYTIVASDANPDRLDWTDYKFVFQRQNNTAGTEWINVTTKYTYIHDDDGGGPYYSDSDDLPDYYETKIGSSTISADSDNDGIDDDDEVLRYGTNPIHNDTDFDGLLDDDEISWYGSSFPDTNEDEWDPDGDGFPNWIDFDSDNDGLNDSYEDNSGDASYSEDSSDNCDWLNNDTDGDGILDGTEVLWLTTNPESNDTDEDGLTDGYEATNGMNPIVEESNDWLFFFGDDFASNNLVEDKWTDISVYGSMTRGGLATTTVYNDFEAEEDLVSRIYNNSGDWECEGTTYPSISQKSSGSIKGFVATWNLSLLRSNNPAEAIETAEIDLDYYGNFAWDSDDDISLQLINPYYNGSCINDSSSDSDVNYTMWRQYEPPELTNIDVTVGATSTLDIKYLFDRWYLYSNSSIFSVFFYPDSENSLVGSEEYIIFDSWTFDPRITIVTGDSVLRATSYGSGTTGTTGGPLWVTNFGSDIDDFEVFFEGYVKEEANKMGYLDVNFWTGDNGTGSSVYRIMWYDSWYSSTNRFYFQEYTGGTWVNNYYLSSTTNKYDDWTTAGEDNCSFTRNGSSLIFTTNGASEYTGSNRNTTKIRSMTVGTRMKYGYSVIDKLGIRNIRFQGHSDDYDDDGLNSIEEQTNELSVWNSDADADGIPDGWEVTYNLDPLDDSDAVSDPDGDSRDNLEEYQDGTNPNVVDADVLASSYIYENDVWAASKFYFDIGVEATYYIKVEYRVNDGSWVTERWASALYSVGSYSVTDAQLYQYEGNDDVDVRWSIYLADGTTLLDTRTESMVFS